MAEHDYKPNSHKYREEKKTNSIEKERMPKVVNGPVKTRKNEIRKLTDIFIAEDASNVKSYLFLDVLVPALKKVVEDMVIGGIKMALWGDGGRGRSGDSKGGYVSYRQYSDRDGDRYARSESRARATRFDYDDIIFNDRGDAEAVLDQMDDAISRYGQVSVGDMYDMARLTYPYTSDKYGWTSLRSAEVIRVRDGYVLKLPRPVVLD